MRTTSSPANRYWNSLTDTDRRAAAEPAVRGRAGYSFWQRYRASFTGVRLPVIEHSPTHSSASAREQRLRPTVIARVAAVVVSGFVLGATAVATVLLPGQPTVGAMATPTVSTSPAIARGDLLGSYHRAVTAGVSTPLGSTVVFLNGSSGDVGVNLIWRSDGLHVSGAATLVRTPGNAPPTFQSCEASTLFVQSVTVREGRNFCLVGPDWVVGATMTRVEANQAALHLLVWKK
jgi:hypothetical protein